VSVLGTAGAAPRRDARYEAVRARLNLHAVLPGLEDVVAGDAEMAALVAGADLTVHFRVAGGPAAAVRFAGSRCRAWPLGAGAGAAADTAVRGTETGARADRGAGNGADRDGESPDRGGRHRDGEHGAGGRGGGGTVTLWFTSPAHLNRMFDGSGTPIPLRGFGKLGFMQKEFTQLSDRLAHYLKPTPELLGDPDYLAMNTRLMLTTAAFAVPILLECDPVAAGFRRAFDSGSIALTVLPDGPSVGLLLGPQRIVAVKGEIDSPTALIRMRDVHIASAFLNGTLDTFAAVACGDVEISGQLPKVDALGLVLERVPIYLS